LFMRGVRSLAVEPWERMTGLLVVYCARQTNEPCARACMCACVCACMCACVQAPAHIARRIDSIVSADWVVSLCGGLVTILMILSLHIATDFNGDGQLDTLDVSYVCP
jgi:hypothetical protein